MVSIAESFNYRIFERKRRMGEALLSHPRACHILSVEQKTTHTYICTYIYMHIVVYFCVCVCVWIAYLLEMGKVGCGECVKMCACVCLSLSTLYINTVFSGVCEARDTHARAHALFIYMYIYILLCMYACVLHINCVRVCVWVFCDRDN